MGIQAVCIRCFRQVMLTQVLVLTYVFPSGDFVGLIGASGRHIILYVTLLLTQEFTGERLG